MKNIVKAAKKIVKYQEGGVAGGDYAWLKDILDYESKAGSASGTGLKNYGIKRDKWGKKYDYLDKDEITEEDAIRFMKEEYLPKVKDYPEDVQKRLVDYMYNTGRNIEDVLMHAAGLVDLESVQTKNTDYELFNKNRDAILKSMSDPEFVKKIDNSKHEILKDYWTRKGTPDVYEKTSKKRIDMWNKEEPNSSFNPDPTATSSNVDVKVPGVKTAEQSKQEIQNAIDKEKAMSSNSWSDADISSLLSRGITAQDYKKETLTDYAVGKVPALPTETTKPTSVNTSSKAPEQTKPTSIGSKPTTEPAKAGSKTPTKPASTGNVSIPKENLAAINAIKKMKEEMSVLDENNKRIKQNVNVINNQGEIKKINDRLSELDKDSEALAKSFNLNKSDEDKKRWSDLQKKVMDERLQLKNRLDSIQTNNKPISPIASEPKQEQRKAKDTRVFENKVSKEYVFDRNSKYGLEQLGVVPTKDTYMEAYSIQVNDKTDKELLETDTNTWGDDLTARGAKRGIEDQLRLRGYELKDGKWVKNPKKPVIPKKKKGGYIHKMQVGGIAGDPPKGRRYRRVNGSAEHIFIEGEDGNLYFSGNGGSSYAPAPKQLKDTFYNQLAAQKTPTGILMWSVDDSGNQPSGTSRRMSTENGENPGLTTDPTEYGQEITPGQKTPPKSGGSDQSTTPGENGENPGLTEDPTEHGQEITPGDGGMFGSFDNPLGIPRDMPIIPPSDTGSPKTPGIADTGNRTNPGDTGSGSSTTPTDVDDIKKRFNELIDKRKADVEKTAEEQLAEYRALQRRTNSRDLASLITSAGGRLLQNREQIPFLKQKRFLNQKYPTYSAQRINQESEAASGAGMEMVKFMNRESGSLSSRLAPILFSRLMEQQGRARRQYNDFNISQEAKKYDELGNIIDHNQQQIVASKNQKIDNTNKTIAGVSSDVNAFLASMNKSDGKMVDTKIRIDSKRRDDIYKLDNQKLEIELYGLDYAQKKAEIDKRIEEHRRQLEGEDIDEAHRRTLEENMERLRKLKEKLEVKNMIQ